MDHITGTKSFSGKKDVIGKCLDALGSKMKKAAGKILSKVQTALKNPEVKNRNQEQVR